MFGFIAWLIELGFLGLIIALLWGVLRTQVAMLRHLQQTQAAPARKRVAKAKERT